MLFLCSLGPLMRISIDSPDSTDVSSSIYLWVRLAFWTGFSISFFSSPSSTGSSSFLYSKVVSPKIVTLLLRYLTADKSLDFLSISLRLAKFKVISSFSSSSSSEESEETSAAFPWTNSRCSISTLKAVIWRLSGQYTWIASKSFRARWSLFFYLRAKVLSCRLGFGAEGKESENGRESRLSLKWWEPCRILRECIREWLWCWECWKPQILLLEYAYRNLSSSGMLRGSS